MGKKKREAEPPSLFDNLDMFAQPREKSEAQPETPLAVERGLTGAGPMRDLFDFNFRQYSA